MRLYIASGEKLLDPEEYGIEVDDASWFSPGVVRNIGALNGAWKRCDRTSRSPRWDEMVDGLLTYWDDIHLVRCLVVTMFGKCSPTLAASEFFFFAFFIQAIRLGYALGMFAEDPLEHKHTDQHVLTRKHPAGGVGTLAERRHRCLRWIVLTEKLRERVLEERSMETLLLHLGTLESEAKGGFGKAARYPRHRRYSLPALGIMRTPEKLQGVLDALRERERAAVAKAVAAATAHVTDDTPMLDAHPDATAAAAAADPELALPPPSSPVPMMPSESQPESTPGGPGSAVSGAAAGVEASPAPGHPAADTAPVVLEDEGSENGDGEGCEEIQEINTPEDLEAGEEEERQGVATLLEELGLEPPDNIATATAGVKKKAPDILEIKNVLSITLAGTQYEITHDKPSLRFIWSRQKMQVVGTFKGALQKIEIEFAAISALGKQAGEASDSAEETEPSGTLIVGLCSPGQLEVMDMLKKKVTKKKTTMGDWATRFVDGHSPNSFGSQFIVQLAADDLECAWAALAAGEKYDASLAELAATQSTEDRGWDLVKYEQNKASRKAQTVIPLHEDEDETVRKCDEFVQRHRDGTLLDEAHALSCNCGCNLKVFKHDVFVICKPSSFRGVALKDMVVVAEEGVAIPPHSVCVPMPVVRKPDGALELHVVGLPRRWEEQPAAPAPPKKKIAAGAQAKAAAVRSAGAGAGAGADARPPVEKDTCVFCGKQYNKIKNAADDNPMRHSQHYLKHIGGEGKCAPSRPTSRAATTPLDAAAATAAAEVRSSALAEARGRICSCALCQGILVTPFCS